MSVLTLCLLVLCSRPAQASVPISHRGDTTMMFEHHVSNATSPEFPSGNALQVPAPQQAPPTVPSKRKAAQQKQRRTRKLIVFGVIIAAAIVGTLVLATQDR